MDKKPFQDVTPPQRRSIRNIPLSQGRQEGTAKKQIKNDIVPPVKKEEIKKEEIKISHYEEYVDFEEDYSEEHKPRWGKVVLWTGALALVIGGFFFVSSFFKSATVEIQVKNVTAPVDTDIRFSCTTGDASCTPRAGSLSFNIVSSSQEVSQAVAASGEKQVSSKATGKIVVYNKNTTAQKLIAQTRFKSAAGKIYRLLSAVTVPAGKKSGSSITAGSLAISVTADVPGTDYNAPLTDFTLPGFEGSPKYTTVYARSKTEMTGGALGTVKVASADDVAKVEASLTSTLSEQLIKEVKQQTPESFILLDNLYSINYEPTVQETKDDGVLITKKAKVVGILINTDSVASYLASQAVKGYSQEGIKIANLNELTFTPSVATSSITSAISDFTLKVKGSAHFVYSYDAEKLKQDLIGMARESFPTVVATYPGIEKANAVIKPFWNGRFPQEEARITIKEQ